MLKMAADWIYKIAAVMLLGAVALQAVPQGTYQKYVRLFLGGLLILTVLSPLLSGLGLSQKTALYYQRDVLSAWLGSMTGSGENEDAQAQVRWQEEVRSRNEAALEEPLQVLVGEYGFLLSSYFVEWNEDGTQPEALTLTVIRKQGEDAEEEEISGGEAEIEPVRTVDPVGRENGSMTAEDGTYYEPSELRELHQALETVLGLRTEQITIYWNRQ